MKGLIPTAGTLFSVDNPYRKKRPSSQKIIFLACEGRVTEEEYFYVVAELFNSVKSRIQIISVAEDEIRTRENIRTREQNSVLGKNEPKHLVERIERFKKEKDNIYQFSQHSEDEFWIVMDLDKNTEQDKIDDFEEALDICDEKGYGYAISNPLFEMWLLLHHDEVRDEDRAYAVTPNHKYEPTNHFVDRLKDLNVPMRKKKHICREHYTLEKIKEATERARTLHIDENRYPNYYATTVYKLLDKMFEMY